MVMLSTALFNRIPVIYIHKSGRHSSAAVCLHVSPGLNRLISDSKFSIGVCRCDELMTCPRCTTPLSLSAEIWDAAPRAHDESMQLDIH